MNDKNNGLGRGLDSLMDEAQAAETPVKGSSTGFRQMNIADILVPTSEAEVSDEELPPLLVDSVRDYGILQPLLIRKVPQGYMLIDGRKRLAAANRCQLTSVPVIVMRVSSEDADSVRSAANWRTPSATPAAAAADFSHLDEDDTRPPSRGHVKWVYVVTAIVLLLIVVADVHIRTKKKRSAKQAAPVATALEPENTPAAPPTPAETEKPRPHLVGDLPEPTNPEPLVLPPPDEEQAAAALVIPEPDAATPPPAATNAPPVQDTAVADTDTPRESDPPAEMTASTEEDTSPDTTTPPEEKPKSTTTAEQKPATPPAFAITGEGIDIRTADDGIQLVFEQPVFRFRTVMHEAARTRLKDIAGQLVPVASNLNITVVGHTDSDPMPANARYADNNELGLDRARTAALFMVKVGGLAEGDVNVASWGENNPPHSNDAYDSRVRNRTVSLLVTPKR